MDKVIIYTDGACSGNPGPGGWGAILMFNDIKKEISGGKKDTTNNIMEITAVIQALTATLLFPKISLFVRKNQSVTYKMVISDAMRKALIGKGPTSQGL